MASPYSLGRIYIGGLTLFYGTYKACNSKFRRVQFWVCSYKQWGHVLTLLVETLLYEPESRGFDSR